jgi:hypothetical protein
MALELKFKPPRLPGLSRRGFVLVVGDDGALLHGAGVGGGPLFTPSFDDPATGQIVTRLRRHPRMPVSILFDVLEQSFRREGVPKVNLLDAAKVVRRRMEMAFPVSQLRGHVKMAPDKDQPRQDQYMFIGLAESDLVNKWVNLLGTLPNPIGGLSSLPLEAVPMAERLGAVAGRPAATFTALVTWNLVGGFRQVVVRDGELVFTRLTPTVEAASDGAELGANLEREFRATLGYLNRLGFAEGSTLRVVAVLPDRAREAVGRLRIAGDTPLFMTPSEAAKRLGLGRLEQTNDQYADLLHAVHSARQGTLAASLLTPALRQRQQLEQGGLWLGRAAIAGVVAGIVYGSWLGAESLLASYELAGLRDQVATQTRLLAAEEARLAKFPAALATVNGAITLDDLLMKRRADPFALLAAMAPGTTAQMRLSELEWLVVPLPVPGTPDYARMMQAPPPSQPVRLTMRPILVGNGLTREAAVADIRRFEGFLRGALPDYTVQVTRYPVDILPNQTLSNRNVPGDLPLGAAFDAAVVVTGPQGRRP